MERSDVTCRHALDGPIADLAAAIRAGTGRPGPIAGPAFRVALAAAFPDLLPPDEVEGCTSHPALTLRLRVPGLGREAVKVVLVPRDDGLEARVRAEVPAGSYRRETLLRIAEAIAGAERALRSPGRPGPAGPPGRSEP